MDKDLEDLGLYVEEEEDELSLKHGNQVIAQWYPPAANNEDIRRTARDWARKQRETRNNVTDL